MKNYKVQAQKLQAKYLQDENFQREVDQRYKKYQILFQQSIYADLSSISQDLFVCYNRGTYPIYFYFGMMQKVKKQNLHKLAMYFIKFFSRKPTQDYTFVFLNTNATSDAYGLFKQIFLQLTIDHFLHLREFILLRPTYYQRAQDYMSFSVFPNYLRNLTTHVFSGVQLCQYLEINPQDFVDIVPAEISNYQFPKLKARKLSLEDQRINFQGQLLDQKDRVLKKQFQSVMKSFLIVKPGKQTYQLYDYQLNKFGIPVVLDMLIFYFKTHPQGLKQQGLFRKSVSIEEQNQKISELVNKNYDCLLSITNPHIIANLLKRFFSNLKIPVFPFKQFQQIMHDQGVSDKKLHLKNIVNSLPQLNYLCLLFLIQFLKQDVITKVQYNKMTAQNISICFGPCLLRAQKASAADLIYASKCAMATRILLDQFQYVFGDRRAIQQKYRVSEDIRTKQISQQIQQNIKYDKSQRSSKSKSSRSSVSSIRKLKSQQLTFSKMDNPLMKLKVCTTPRISSNRHNQYLDEQQKQKINNQHNHYTIHQSHFSFNPNNNHNQQIHHFDKDKGRQTQHFHIGNQKQIQNKYQNGNGVQIKHHVNRNSGILKPQIRSIISEQSQQCSPNHVSNQHVIKNVSQSSN